MNDSYDVFLSYNSQDIAIVRELAQALQSRNLRVWLDEDELVPGRSCQEALEKIIQTTKAAAVLIGASGIGPWQNQEMRAIINEFITRKLPVLTVFLPNAPNASLPLFLKDFTWVDMRDGLTDQGLNRIQWGITGTKPGHSPSFVEEQPSPSKPNEKLENHAAHGGKRLPEHSVSEQVVLKVRAELGKLLRGGAAQDIGKALLLALSPQNQILPEELLAPLGVQPFPVAEKIDALHDAVRDTFESLAEQRRPIPLVEAKQMLEWLLLTAVPDSWVKTTGRGSDMAGNDFKNEIAEKHEIWAEIGDGRLTLKRPRLELGLGDDPNKIRAPNQLSHSDIEHGMRHIDASTQILKEIYIKVMKYEPPSDEDWKAQLPYTLERRRKDDERYHIAIPHDRYTAIAGNSVWAKELNDILPFLGVFVYGSGNDNRILIVPENKLIVAIREYLHMLRKYK